MTYYLDNDGYPTEKALKKIREWNFDADSDRYRKYASGKTPQIAIMKAFLEVMEVKNG